MMSDWYVSAIEVHFHKPHIAIVRNKIRPRFYTARYLKGFVLREHCVNLLGMISPVSDLIYYQEVESTSSSYAETKSIFDNLMPNVKFHECWKQAYQVVITDTEYEIYTPNLMSWDGSLPSDETVHFLGLYKSNFINHDI